MKLVLDTDVVVAAMRSPNGASAEILRAADRGRVQLLVSPALALEYEAVCMTPRHVAAAGVTTAQVEVFVSTLISLAAPVEIHFRWRPVLRDPGDEMVLEAAVNGGSDALVTFNHRDFRRVWEEFGLRVWLPKDALAAIRRLK